MLRLFPLLSVTIIFFLIFSSVRNLTVKNDIQVTEENKDFLKNEMKVSPKSTFKDNMIDQLDTKNSNLSENSVKDVQNKKIESDLNTNLNKSIEYKEKKSGQRVQKKNNAELKIIEKKETISADKVKNSNATYLKSDGKKIKNEKKVIKEVKVQSNEYRIQFGAFSKKSNALALLFYLRLH